MTANILAAICVYCITWGNTRGKIYDVHCQTVFLYWHISQKSLHCIYSIVLIKSVIQTLHQPKFYRGHNKQKTYQPFNYPLLSAWFYICWWCFFCETPPISKRTWKAKGGRSVPACWKGQGKKQDGINTEQPIHLQQPVWRWVAKRPAEWLMSCTHVLYVWRYVFCMI